MQSTISALLPAALVQVASQVLFVHTSTTCQKSGVTSFRHLFSVSLSGLPSDSVLKALGSRWFYTRAFSSPFCCFI